MAIGKILGAFFGFLVLGPLGLIIGLFAGHYFDRGLKQVQLGPTAEQRREIEARFISTLFPLLGHMAKADGRVSEQEIAHTEALINQYGLSTEHRAQAINLFKLGAESSYDATVVVRDFYSATHLQPDLRRVILTYLVGMAMADGELHQGEEAALRGIAEGLGFAGIAFDRLMDMLRAQGQFRGQQAPASGDELTTAYKALGVVASVGDVELKKAYRKLMSENHPDKLMGQGVPEDMIKLATERSQEIQRAYDIIRKSRKS